MPKTVLHTTYDNKGFYESLCGFVNFYSRINTVEQVIERLMDEFRRAADGKQFATKEESEKINSGVLTVEENNYISIIMENHKIPSTDTLSNGSKQQKTII